MKTLEIKGGLYEMISKVDDQQLLLHLQSVVKQVIEQNLTELDFWDALSTAQQAELEEALKESEQKENLVPHQVVLDKYEN